MTMAMKTFIWCLALLAFSSLDFAQVETELYVADKPFADIESTVLSVYFRSDRLIRSVGQSSSPVSIFINYGQPCMNPFRGGETMTLLHQCSMLLDASGKALVFDSYILALDFMQRQGWKLIGIVSPSQNSDQISSIYLFSNI
jgi:hypothetical protein